MMEERIAGEIERRFLREGDYICITMKRSGQKFHIYRQRYGIAVYLTDGNIWTSKERKPYKYFPNQYNALKQLARFIQENA